jgi:O-antigen/teichoic acid export membrane protein
MLALSAVDRFTQTGIEEALIQRKNAIERYVDVAWTINLARSFVVFALLYLLAPFAAHFFRNEQVDPVVKTISLIVILTAFTNIGIVYLQRDLTFKKLFIYKFSGNIADFIVAIPVALIMRSVWALVCGLLVGHCTRLVVSYLIHPYRPKLEFNWNVASEILKFGGWLTGISIIAFLINQGDDAVIGRVMGTTSLGFYYLAFFIANLPATEINLLVPRVTLPAYARIKGDTQRLKESYLRVLQMTAFVVIPSGIGLLLLAPEFTMIFLGTKWKPIIIPLQVLAISGILAAFLSAGSSLFYAHGRPRIEFQVQFLRLLVLASIIYPLTVKWGMTGTAVGVVISSAVVIPVWLLRSIQIIEANLTDIVQKIIPVLIASSVMSVGVYVLKQTFYEVSLLRFFYLVLFGICLYFSTHFIIWKCVGKGPLDELKAMFA